jgi:hypothetical protein
MRHYVEVNPDLGRGFVISFNSMANIGSMQVVHHIIYCESLTNNHLELMTQWIQTHSL